MHRYAGLSYPIADGWVLGAGGGGGHPPRVLVVTDTTHGTGCSWGERPESTYSENRYVTCSYTGSTASGAAAKCHPGAHPPEVCPGSGVRVYPFRFKRVLLNSYCSFVASPKFH